MQFNIQNPAAHGPDFKIPEQFWMIVVPGVAVPSVGYTEKKEAYDEAAMVYTRIPGQKFVYVMTVEKVAMPKVPAVDFKEPEASTKALTTT